MYIVGINFVFLNFKSGT